MAGWNAVQVMARQMTDRWASAEDVAGAVRYLVEADYVPGEMIFIDGGEHLA